MPHTKYRKTEICQEGLHKASTPASASSRTHPQAEKKRVKCKFREELRFATNNVMLEYNTGNAAMTFENVYSLADSSSELPEGYLSGSHKVLDSAALQRD
jgi:hypothetical protein